MMLLGLFLIFLGFVSAFSFSDILPIPMVISFAMLLYLALKIMKNGKIKKIPYKIMLPLGMFLIVMLISFFIQIQSIGYSQTGLNHLLSYFTTILAYFIVPILYMKHFRVPTSFLFKYITIGVLGVSIFIIAEFTLKNFFNIPFDEFIYRPIENSYIATYSLGGERYIRARGVAQESGHAAMYLSMFLPFVYYYYKNILHKKLELVLSIMLVVTALVLTFSATALAEIALAGFVLFIIFIVKKLKKGFKKLEVLAIWASSIIMVPMVYYILTSSNFETIRMKLSMNTASGESRLVRWKDALELFGSSPVIGGGPGITSILYGTGSTSFYLELLTQVGIIGFIFMLIALFAIFKSVLSFKGTIKLVYMFSFLITVVHLLVISNYWYPWMWILFAIIVYDNGILEKENTKIALA